MYTEDIVKQALRDYLNRDDLTFAGTFWQGLIAEMVEAYEAELKQSANHSVTGYSVDGYSATVDTRGIMSKYAGILAPYKRLRTLTKNASTSRPTKEESWVDAYARKYL